MITRLWSAAALIAAVASSITVTDAPPAVRTRWISSLLAGSRFEQQDGMGGHRISGLRSSGSISGYNGSSADPAGGSRSGAMLD